MSTFLDEIAEALSASGSLAQQVEGFAPREQQQRMAAAVGETLEHGESCLVIEAGTGIGKTFAYLVPALLCDQRVIVSTGTRTLQDQLFHKDIPLVRAALNRPLSVALLKGRGNYLCRYRLILAKGDGRLGHAQLDALSRVSDWARRTVSGDISELAEIAEDSPIWPTVTSTADNCLGAECPEVADCYLLQARKRAQDAELLVINHHLFCADMALREEGFGEVLPGADALIFDEAHQLPDVAGRFFGRAVGSRALNDLARDIEVERERDAPDDLALHEWVVESVDRVGALQRALGAPVRREAWSVEVDQTALSEAYAALTETLEQLLSALEAAAVRAKGLEACFRRAGQLLSRWRCFSPTAEVDENLVLWVDVHRHSFTLHATPLSVAAFFRERMVAYPTTWIFTSATLSVGGDFHHFTDQLGLDGVRSEAIDSPFDYQRNALLYHPCALPDPSANHYNRALLEASLPVLRASGGRAFILFTSHHALREAALWLAPRIDYPLLVQGEQPKNRLLQRFRELGNAVLVATSSFWEGVDVRGEALSCVIIAKLPFASPSDPVLQARIDALRRRGRNPFIEWQLPQAVIALKQGVGRLIRDVDDRGVLLLGDPRLLTKPYGKIFLDALPPMQRNRSVHAVERFFGVGDPPP